MLTGNLWCDAVWPAARARGACRSSSSASPCRRYDGHGNFTQTDNTHGLSASVTDQPGWGTYTVNSDCSGTKTLWLQGLPFPIENRIVVLEEGKEIRIVVMSPPPIVVTAQGRRVF